MHASATAPAVSETQGMPAGRRAAAAVVVTDPAGRVLLVQTIDDDGPPRWGLPAGGVEPGELAHVGAARELWEETGLRAEVTDVLVVDQMPARPAVAVPPGEPVPPGARWLPEGLTLVFRGPRLTAEEAAAVTVPAHAAGEIGAVAWVTDGELDGWVSASQAGRIRRALAQLRAGGGGPLLVLGSPVS